MYPFANTIHQRLLELRGFFAKAWHVVCVAQTSRPALPKNSPTTLRSHTVPAQVRQRKARHATDRLRGAG